MKARQPGISGFYDKLLERLNQDKAPDLLFLILETNPSKQAAVYQKFAAALNA